jgi:alkylhydroperoxidase/carboxymuconolactone decarboxylase family protein YurZ
MTTTTQPKAESTELETGLSEITLNLIALGAAIGSNAERAFRAHQTRLEALGVSKETMIEAVNMALRVKGDPHSIMMALAESTLTEGGGGGCCGGGCACEEAGEEKGSCGEDCDCK